MSDSFIGHRVSIYGYYPYYGYSSDLGFYGTARVERGVVTFPDTADLSTGRYPLIPASVDVQSREMLIQFPASEAGERIAPAPFNGGVLTTSLDIRSVSFASNIAGAEGFFGRHDIGVNLEGTTVPSGGGYVEAFVTFGHGKSALLGQDIASSSANGHGPRLESAPLDLPKPEGWVDPTTVASTSAFDWQGPHTLGASSMTFEPPHTGGPLISSHH